MKQWMATILAFSLLIVLLPSRGLAAELALQVPAGVTVGQTLTMSGTAPGAEVILSIRSADGELVFFDTQRVEGGRYSAAITVPAAWGGSTYRVSAVSGGVEEMKQVVVWRQGGGTEGGNNGGDVGSGEDGNGDNGDDTIPPPADAAPVITADSRGVTVTVTPADSNGRQTVLLDASAFGPILEALSSKPAAERHLVFRVAAGAAAGTAYDVSLNAEAAALLWNSDAASLTIESPLGSARYDRKSLDAIQGAGSGDVRFAMDAVDAAALSAAGRSATGGRPAVDLSVTVGSGSVSDFGGGKVRLGIPYSLRAGEDPNAVVYYYIPSAGAPAVVRGGWYNQSEGVLYAALDHFSVYGIGVNQVSFTDVSGWATDYITYLSARGIIEGIGERLFAPVQPVTRGEFVAILARLSGAEGMAYQSGLFTDVQSGDWYAPYVQWGYESGVVQGTGQNRFQPRAAISRQELAVMVARYAAATEYALPVMNQPLSFGDRSQFGEWAVEAIGALQQAGIIDGLGDGRFNPRGTATRAEAAKMIAVLLQGMSR
ncbi:S-layer homology domain-containing protein [Paenibacillus sp. 1P07SE]|uniref:S-layer homology domain-containing protein n=1 Tax=Paenibacillus sp. 1P07SE TaxID=3132209 RepID=UPI0039A41C6D